MLLACYFVKILNMSEEEKSLEFHIKSQDYFGTLATIISLNRQNIERKKEVERAVETLKIIENNLVYLQKNYSIIKKK